MSKKIFKRTFGNSPKNRTAVNMETQKHARKDLPWCATSPFQPRVDNNYEAHATGIANDVEEDEAKCFTTNIVGVILGGILYIVTGWHRRLAADILAARGRTEFDTLDIDIIQGRNDKERLKLAKRISWLDNMSNQRQKVYTALDKANIAASLVKDDGYDPQDVAEHLGCSLAKAQKYISKGCAIRAKREAAKNNDPDVIQPFTGKDDTARAIVKLFNETLKLDCSNYKQLVQTLFSDYNISLLMHKNDSELHVANTVLQPALNGLTDNKQRNYCAIFYETHGTKSGHGVEYLAVIKQQLKNVDGLRPGKTPLADVHGELISNFDRVLADNRGLWKFCQRCKKTVAQKLESLEV